MPTDPEYSDDSLGEEDFLSRWSRRKHSIRETLPPCEPTDAQAPPMEPPEGVEQPELADADMPPVESLGEHSDISGFLSRGVSEDLRRKALRRVFHLAGYHHRDGLDDYDGDYRSFAPLGDVMTADRRLREERFARRAEEYLQGDHPEERELDLARQDSEHSPGDLPPSHDEFSGAESS